MIKAVLLDLDNTLLVNPDTAFARSFLKALDEYFEPLTGPGISHQFREAIHQLSQKQDGTKSNHNFIDDYIAQANTLSSATVKEAFLGFYQARFPELAGQTQRKSGAGALVETIRRAGLSLVIATNPLHTEHGIKQKLEWAGLPTDEACYTLITTADNMHFAKPDPAYYAEIIGRVGIEPDEAIMVGDSLKNDMGAARAIGLQTFHISDAAHTNEPIIDEAYQHGSLENFHALVQRPQWVHTYQRLPLNAHMIEPQLRGNIGAIHGMLSDIKPEYWLQHPLEDEWSILEIVCHLIESESQTQRRRIQQILNTRNPFIAESRMPDPDMANFTTNGDEVLATFVHERQLTLELIGQLQDDAWYRPARHSIFGNTNLLEMAYFTAQHDRLHLNQICQTLGRCE